MFQKKDYSLILFYCSSLSALFFIDNGHPYIESILKLVSILSLALFYFKNTTHLNYWYLTVLFCSCLSSTFLVFDAVFLAMGTYLLLFNRVLYIIISRRALLVLNRKKILLPLTLFLIPVLIIFPELKSYLGNLSLTILLIGITSAIMASFAFINYLEVMKKENQYFLGGILLFVIADILIAYNKFVSYNLAVVIFYTSIYFIARYFVCKAMLLEKRN